MIKMAVKSNMAAKVYKMYSVMVFTYLVRHLVVLLYQYSNVRYDYKVCFSGMK